MSFKNYINESSRFDDSADATEFFEKIETMMKDKRLFDWAKATDSNYDSHSVQKLQKAIKAYEDFTEELYNAE
jgi:hypothetical protein